MLGALPLAHTPGAPHINRGSG